MTGFGFAVAFGFCISLPVESICLYWQRLSNLHFPSLLMNTTFQEEEAAAAVAWLQVQWSGLVSDFECAAFLGEGSRHQLQHLQRV